MYNVALRHGSDMATGGDFKPSFGGTRDFLPGECRVTGVTLETHMDRVSSFSFLSYLLNLKLEQNRISTSQHQFCVPCL